MVIKMDVKIDGGIQNTLSKFTEDFSDYNDSYKIRLFMDILESDYVNDDVKQRIKKQLNKEIIRKILFEEEYDEWFRNNLLEDDFYD